MGWHNQADKYLCHIGWTWSRTDGYLWNHAYQGPELMGDWCGSTEN